jgi:hypothetical protein
VTRRALQVETGHLSQLDGGVLLLLQNITRRGCDLSCGEDARGHWIQQAREQMVVGATDQDDLDYIGRASQ